MKNIIELSEKQKKFLLEGLTESKRIDSGAEGDCYLITDGGTTKVLKIFNDSNSIDNRSEDYKVEDIIMESDYKLKSFAFPNTLYVCNGKIIGYTTRYIKKDYFNAYTNESLKDINLAALIKAIKKYIVDLEVISNDGIYTYDLCFNLMFDGKYLVGIDTPSYKREKKNLTELDKIAIYKENMKSLKYALINIIKMIALFTQEDSTEYEEAILKLFA